MRRPYRLTAAFVSIAFTCGLWAAIAVASDDGMTAANQVSETSYRSFLGDNQGVAGILYAHDGYDRRYSASHDLARANIVAKFQQYGLSVELDPFTYNSTTYYNVVATKLGNSFPDEEYIIGAHYDSVACPGADDNGSGTALVLEAARIISQYPSEYTIRFIAFDREEQGLIGSDAYATEHAADTIHGMISADMVSYDTGGNHCRMYGQTASNPVKNALGAAISTYGSGLTYTINGGMDASDHAPFEWQGWQACVLIEDYDTNPNYHTTGDSVDTLNYINYPYAVKMTRSVVGWLVDAAGVQTSGLTFAYPNGRPAMIRPAGGTRMRVLLSGIAGTVPQPGTGMLHYNTGGGWQTTPMSVVSPNVYDAIFPAATCGQQMAYYISAQAVGGTVYSDPRSAPTTTYSAIAAYGRSAFYENLLNTNPGWSGTAVNQWAFGHPTGAGSHNHDPSNGHTGTNVYGYNLGGDYTNNISPARYLTTTPINCTGRQMVQLQFYRWLGVESNTDYDEATIEVSNNGTTYTVIWRATDTGADVSDASWQFQQFDISAIADNRATVYIRWGMGPTDPGLTFPGWNIDDVRLTALDCQSPCPDPADGDLDGSGATNGVDIQSFITALLGTPTQIDICRGDFSNDGYLDSADVPGMVSALLAP
jgi:hypothetical protein